MTTDTRLGMVEGRVEEHAAAIADLREGQREIRNALAAMNSRIDEVNSRIDRLFLAILGIGAAQIALLVTLIVTFIFRS